MSFASLLMAPHLGLARAPIQSGWEYLNSDRFDPDRRYGFPCGRADDGHGADFLEEDPGLLRHLKPDPLRFGFGRLGCPVGPAVELRQYAAAIFGGWQGKVTGIGKRRGWFLPELEIAWGAKPCSSVKWAFWLGPRQRTEKEAEAVLLKVLDVLRGLRSGTLSWPWRQVGQRPSARLGPVTLSLYHRAPNPTYESPGGWGGQVRFHGTEVVNLQISLCHTTEEARADLERVLIRPWAMETNHARFRERIAAFREEARQKLLAAPVSLSVVERLPEDAGSASIPPGPARPRRPLFLVPPPGAPVRR